MKKRIVLSLILACFFALSSFAQKVNKFGHINSAELLGLMPERKVAAAKMDTITKEMQKQLEEMMTEYKAKQDKYVKDQPTMSAPVKATKEEELQSIGTRIQSFQQTAQESIEEQQQKLMEPIISKAKKVIEVVAKENGYTYIFDTSLGSLLYWEESDNVLNLVKKKLNLP